MTLEISNVILSTDTKRRWKFRTSFLAQVLAQAQNDVGNFQRHFLDMMGWGCRREAARVTPIPEKDFSQASSAIHKGIF